MNENFMRISDELAREHFRIGASYVMESCNINPKKVKLVYSNDMAMRVTVEMPSYLIEAEIEERGLSSAE